MGGQRDIAGLASTSEEISITINNNSGIAGIGINGFEYFTLLNSSMNEQNALDAIALLINTNNSDNHTDATVLGAGANATLQVATSSGYIQLDIDLNPEGNEQTWALVNQAGQGSAVHNAMIAHMNDVVNAPLASFDYVFVPLYNPDFYDGKNPDYLGYINLWDWTTNSFMPNSSLADEGWRNTYIPFPRLTYLLQQSLKFLGYTDISSFTSTLEFQQIHLWNNVSLDQDWGGINYGKTYINLKDHIPEDMTISDLFKYIRDTLNISIEINYTNKTIDFVKKASIPNHTAEDWTYFSTEKYIIQRTQTEDLGYSLSHKEDSDDWYFSSFSEAVLKGKEYLNSAKKIENSYPPLPPYNQFHPINNTGEWRTPVIGQIGKTVYPEVEDKGYIIRTFFYKGFKSGLNVPDTYPFGTMVNIDWGGANIGAYSLHLTTLAGISSRGIREEFFEKIEENENPEISQIMDLDFMELKKLKYHTPKIIQHEDGTVNCIIKSIDFQMSMDKIGLSNIKFQRI